MSHLVCYPASFDFLLFPFLGWFCVLWVSQVFLEVGSVVGVLGSGNVSTSNSKTLGPVQWEDEAQVTLCRTFGYMAGNRSWLLCTNSGSRCVRWGVFTALQKAPDVLYLSLPCHSALLWDLSALPSILAVPILVSFSSDTLSHYFGFLTPSVHHNCAHFWLASLSHGWCLPSAGFFLPGVIFFFFSGVDVSYTVFPFGPNTTHYSYWLLLGLFLARFPHSRKTLVWISSWTNRIMQHRRLPLTMAGLQLEEVAFTWPLP